MATPRIPTIVLDNASVGRLLKGLEYLSRSVRTKHLRIGMNAWGGVVRDIARGHVQEETGLLKKSLAVKVKIPDASFNKAHHGKPAYAFVGPGRHSGRMMRRNAKGNLMGFGKAQRVLKRQRMLAASAGLAPLAREVAAVAKTLQKFAGQATYRNPTRYAHLVEKGTKHSKAFPFIEPAVRAGETTGMEKLRQKLADGLAQEASKVASKG